MRVKTRNKPKGYCHLQPASNYTGISIRRMKSAIAAGEIQSITVGKTILVHAGSVLDYMDRKGIRLPSQNLNQKQNSEPACYPCTQKHRICLICGKQFHGKQKLCRTCNARHRTIGYSKVPLSVLLIIKNQYPNENPFDVAEENPIIVDRIFYETNRKKRYDIVASETAQAKSKKVILRDYTEKDKIPDFVMSLFRSDESKEILYVTGNKRNPDVHFICKRCGNAISQAYSDLAGHKGHNCNATKSSGEAIVEDFLKNLHIRYLSQRQTLKCVNPKTGSILPYDFEIPHGKIVIEVQGEQHYRYIPYFHGNAEQFEYGKWKDDYKKEYAENNGYRVLYITYDDILSERYMGMIVSAIETRTQDG